MAKTLKEHILFALDSLEEAAFKKFRRSLNDAEVQAGYDKIPRGKLEKADTMDVADLIVNYYLLEYGLSLTLQVLERINQKDVAEHLRKAAGADKHFVDKHREAIISRCTLVEPILDRLFSLEFLTEEQYDLVRAMTTTQNKMRELYKFMHGWGEAGKEAFYRALREQNGPLVRDLGGQ
ncbi:apoptosis-associated speck-like protein containing a CARD isoform X2 [Pleurodeles waltl]|uniref:apoptosis-associated speck-like protein containing a CARD isoform X2 n=1 Tax=Pleurodeles waltl TaxID=8319 RepID=UPI003709A3AF